MSGCFTRFGYRHDLGRTIIAFDFSKKRIVSAGNDGKIRTYSSKHDASPLEHNFGEKVNDIVCKDEYVLVATEAGHVSLQQITDGLVEGTPTRFSAGVNCLALNKDKTRLLAGSSDFIVKVVDLMIPYGGFHEVVLRGHTGPILSVDFDPLDNFAASSSCDGTIRIWRLVGGTEVKVLSLLGRCSDPELASTRCRLKWQPSRGEFLAVPVENVIRLYERNSWAFLRGLRCASVKKAFLECEFSVEDETLAGLSEDGWLVIWRPCDGGVLRKFNDSAFSNVCRMIWPERSTIYCSNKSGAVGFVDLDLPSSDQQMAEGGALSPNTIKSLMDTTDADDFTDLLAIASAQAEEAAASSEDNKMMEDVSDEDDDDDDPNSIAISKIKSTYMTIDKDDDDDNAPSDASSSTPTPTPADTSRSAPPAPGLVARPEIKPFQPGSMPLGFRERFLVWNRIGVVTCFTDSDSKTSSGSIEVEFHDTTLHHSIHIGSAEFTMADLSLTALMLATPGTSDVSYVDAFDDGKSIDYGDLSTILVRPIDVTAGDDASSSGSFDWLTSLPPGEATRAICLVNASREATRVDPYCRGFAVVATSSRLLRIFAQPAPSATANTNALRLLQATSLGLPPISLPGREVVTMASHPFLSILAVVVAWSDEELYWRVFDLSPGGGCSRGWLFGQLTSTFYPLPLSPEPNPSPLTPNASARLTWFGFSDTGNLYTNDSSGVVRRLLHHRSPGASAIDFHWVPVCDTHRFVKPANRRNDCLFVVAVIESVRYPIAPTSSAAALLEDVGAGGEAESDRMQRIKNDAFGYGQVQAIYCKASRWPRPIPRPVVATLPFRIPLCGGLELDQADLEENYLRTMILGANPFWGTTTDREQKRHLAELSFNRLNDRKRVLLRLFALAIKSDSEWASLAVANLMPDLKTVQLAIRYAARLGRHHLAKRLGDIALRLDNVEFEVLESSPETDDDADGKENRSEGDGGASGPAEGDDGGDGSPAAPDDDGGGHDDGGGNDSDAAGGGCDDRPMSSAPDTSSNLDDSYAGPTQSSLGSSSQVGRHNPFRVSHSQRTNAPLRWCDWLTPICHICRPPPLMLEHPKLSEAGAAVFSTPCLHLLTASAVN
uniref:WD_REPEATS_REGION domain-containing protein n=1 Tax=Mesocestoides corti TaxID=53468 RepID=A0A5K3FEV6_MESCO